MTRTEHVRERLAVGAIFLCSPKEGALFLVKHFALLAHKAIDAKDGANGDAAVDVARAIERVKADDVAALERSILDKDGLLVLLAHEDRRLAGRPERVDKDLVGEHVELLDLFALHVRRTGKTRHVRKTRLADERRDVLAPELV